MKYNLFTLFLSLLFISGFSQTSSNYDWLIHGKVKRERLADAKLMFDIIPNFPKQYFSNLINYVSVEISATNEGKIVTAGSSSEVLTVAQKNILNTADFGTDINVKIKFSYKDSANDVYGTGGRIKEIAPVAVTLVPEIEAQFEGGQIIEYLKANVIKQTSDTGAVNKILKATLNFTVDEEGKVIGTKIVRSSSDTIIDELLIEVTNNMPKWNPAQNAKGVKVKQVFNFPFRRNGC